jgi:hypothetical protein
MKKAKTTGSARKMYRWAGLVVAIGMNQVDEIWLAT